MESLYSIFYVLYPLRSTYPVIPSLWIKVYSVLSDVSNH